MNVGPFIRRFIAVHREKLMLLPLLALFLVILDFHQYVNLPVHSVPTPRTVDIPTGSGFFRISEILDDAGLIRKRPYFWVLALGKQSAHQIRAGEYEFSGNLSPAEILKKLVRGEIKDYPVTLPEDLTVRDIAQRLLSFRLIHEQEFMDLATDPAFLASLGIEGESIEGYLFPDTYKFTRSMTTAEIVRIMVRQFWKKVTPELRERAEEMGLSLGEWVTLASIIGRESGNREEKVLISAVFHNRLKRGMKLQSDPTAVYRLEPGDGASKIVRKKDLEADTPHNTYRIRGLPPSPIANPGIDSLRAALYPASVPYLYFVSKNDGSHQFSASLEAHNQAISKYRMNRPKN